MQEQAPSRTCDVLRASDPASVGAAPAQSSSPALAASMSEQPADCIDIVNTSRSTATATCINDGSSRGIACFNPKCPSAASSCPASKPGWLSRSGRIVDLCEHCGLAYEQTLFCDTFHTDETGWRQCTTCKKQVHCGCIVSIFTYILVDTGGIECSSCATRNNTSKSASESYAPHLSAHLWVKEGISPAEEAAPSKLDKFSWTPETRPLFPVPASCNAASSNGGISYWQPLSEGCFSRPIVDVTTGRITPAINYSSNDAKASSEKLPMPLHHANLGLLQQQQRNLGVMRTQASPEDSVKIFSDLKTPPKESSFREESYLRKMVDGTSSQTSRLRWQGKEPTGSLIGINGTQDIHLTPPVNASLTMSLGPSSMKQVSNAVHEPTSSKALGSSKRTRDLRESNKLPDAHEMAQRKKQSGAKPSQAPSSIWNDVSKDASDISLRVARPPVEGRGKNQLLPRYWPRITEQELQQITPGDSNSSITPLFEKMLSASDAGKIGRLVLPKACAEAYFPPISQPEGVPLKILDVNGKEWSFQFRFWPNNNSRMYVLEGVTPCIQSMQLQAGDTVTFSRLDPEGKLVMGYRRAPNSLNSQDPQSFIGTLAHSGGTDNANNATNFSGLSCHGGKVSTDALGAPSLLETGKKGRAFSLKTKKSRLEANDLLDKSRLSWEELQELLQAPLNVTPNVVMIEGHEFEEYEEPPIFQQRDTVSSRACEVQLGQADDKPDNVSSPTKACELKRFPYVANSAQEENDELDCAVKHIRGEDAPSGLEALANAAAMGESKVSPLSPTPTTKHPRHRSGCTCIVCIQPPSGKGPKHKASCTCNVCTTVKRRFKTLMLRRKKRLSEQEADGAAKKGSWAKEVIENGPKPHCEIKSLPESFSSDAPVSSGVPAINGPLTLGCSLLPMGIPSAIDIISTPKEEWISDKASIDLNSQPERDDEMQKDTGRVSMMMLLQSANYPLENYLQQQGLSNLSCHNQSMSASLPGNVGTPMLEENTHHFHFLASDKPHDQVLGFTQDNLDSTKTTQTGCLQNPDLINQACSFHVSSQSS